MSAPPRFNCCAAENEEFNHWHPLCLDWEARGEHATVFVIVGEHTHNTDEYPERSAEAIVTIS